MEKIYSMLNINIDSNAYLDNEKKLPLAIKHLKDGKDLFVFGRAGQGKTRFIQELFKYLSTRLDLPGKKGFYPDDLSNVSASLNPDMKLYESNDRYEFIWFSIDAERVRDVDYIMEELSYLSWVLDRHYDEETSITLFDMNGFKGFMFDESKDKLYEKITTWFAENWEEFLGGGLKLFWLPIKNFLQSKREHQERLSRKNVRYDQNIESKIESLIKEIQEKWSRVANSNLPVFFIVDNYSEANRNEVITSLSNVFQSSKKFRRVFTSDSSNMPGRFQFVPLYQQIYRKDVIDLKVPIEVDGREYSSYNLVRMFQHNLAYFFHLKNTGADEVVMKSFNNWLSEQKIDLSQNEQDFLRVLWGYDYPVDLEKVCGKDLLDNVNIDRLLGFRLIEKIEFENRVFHKVFAPDFFSLEKIICVPFVEDDDAVRFHLNQPLDLIYLNHISAIHLRRKYQSQIKRVLLKTSLEQFKNSLHKEAISNAVNKKVLRSLILNSSKGSPGKNKVISYLQAFDFFRSEENCIDFLEFTLEQLNIQSNYLSHSGYFYYVLDKFSKYIELENLPIFQDLKKKCNSRFHSICSSVVLEGKRYKKNRMNDLIKGNGVLFDLLSFSCLNRKLVFSTSILKDIELLERKSNLARKRLKNKWFFVLNLSYFLIIGNNRNVTELLPETLKKESGEFGFWNDFLHAIVKVRSDPNHLVELKLVEHYKKSHKRLIKKTIDSMNVRNLWHRELVGSKERLDNSFVATQQKISIFKELAEVNIIPRGLLVDLGRFVLFDVDHKTDLSQQAVKKEWAFLFNFFLTEMVNLRATSHREFYSAITRVLRRNPEAGTAAKQENNFFFYLALTRSFSSHTYNLDDANCRETLFFNILELIGLEVTQANLDMDRSNLDLRYILVPFLSLVRSLRAKKDKFVNDLTTVLELRHISLSLVKEFGENKELDDAYLVQNLANAFKAYVRVERILYQVINGVQNREAALSEEFTEETLKLLSVLVSNEKVITRAIESEKRDYFFHDVSYLLGKLHEYFMFLDKPFHVQEINVLVERFFKETRNRAEEDVVDIDELRTRHLGNLSA